MVCRISAFRAGRKADGACEAAPARGKPVPAVLGAAQSEPELGILEYM